MSLWRALADRLVPARALRWARVTKAPPPASGGIMARSVIVPDGTCRVCWHSVPDASVSIDPYARIVVRGMDPEAAHEYAREIARRLATQPLPR